ncbi:MAG: hypothetical protein M1559_00275 [Candidatus Marsarchaeota archaeon]|nr:hypothetical protein [Candidatus Marsarchaeota archaeon]
MAKLIAVNEEVYAKLKRLKGTSSFSTLLDGLIEKKSGDIKKYFGVWRDKDNLDKLEAEITTNRKIAGLKRKKYLAGV